MSHHIFRLLDRHQKLDDALREEQKQRAPNSQRLERLNRLQHVVKDRLSRLAHGPYLAPSD